MQWISFLSAGLGETYFNLDTHKCISKQAGELDKNIIGFSFDLSYMYYSTCKYSLRDNMARNLRRQFYKQHVDSGNVSEMFLAWDRSSFQLDSVIEVGENRFFAIAGFGNIENRAYFVDDQGKHPEEVWRTAGVPYWFQLSPNRQWFAYHLAHYDEEFNPDGIYAINLMDMKGNRRLVCSEERHLYFGPTWSPDGKQIAFLDCIHEDDPAHHFADVMVYNIETGELKRLTENRPHYFGTSHGLERYRFGGSNVMKWTNDGKLVISRMFPGSHPDCYFDANQRDHEELIYDPSQGVGGCWLSLLDVDSGQETPLTDPSEGVWDFRVNISTDGMHMLYTHSRFGEAPEIWLCNLQSGENTMITKGKGGNGADYASFLPLYIE